MSARNSTVNAQPVATAAVCSRLVKMLALLASPVPGERDAAACAAVRLLEQHKLSWADVVGPARLVSRASTPRASQAGHEHDWHGTLRECLACIDLVTEWERGFLETLAARCTISPRQLVVLGQIARTLRSARGAA